MVLEGKNMTPRPFWHVISPSGCGCVVGSSLSRSTLGGCYQFAWLYTSVYWIWVATCWDSFWSPMRSSMSPSALTLQYRPSISCGQSLTIMALYTAIGSIEHWPLWNSASNMVPCGYLSINAHLHLPVRNALIQSRICPVTPVEIYIPLERYYYCI